MGELITLQFGTFANYVGTHYWNIQNSNYEYCQANNIEHEIESSLLWRSDETNGGVLKYTPRLVTVDLKDSKGSLNKDGYIVHELPNTTSNDRNIQTFVQETARAAPVFEETVEDENSNEPPRSPEIEYWSDFLSIDFHPHSVFELSDFKFGIHEFDKYHEGQTFMKNVYEVDEIVDKARKFLEEANSPHGFQVITDTHNGFGAIAPAILDLMHDEFSKPALTFGVSPTHYTQADPTNLHSMLCTSLSMLALSKASSVYVPVVMDWSFFAARLKTHKEETLYHSSAVIAASIDTATLHYRTFERKKDFAKTINMLAPIEDLNVCSLATSFPFELPPSMFTPATEGEQKPQLLHPLIPQYVVDTVYGQIYNLRGSRQQPLPTVQEKLVQLYQIPSRNAICSVISQPFDAPKTFPSLLYQRPFFPRSIVTQLEQSKGIYPYLKQTAENLKQMKSIAWSFPELDYSETYEELFNKSEG